MIFYTDIQSTDPTQMVSSLKYFFLISQFTDLPFECRSYSDTLGNNWNSLLILMQNWSSSFNWSYKFFEPMQPD